MLRAAVVVVSLLVTASPSQTMSLASVTGASSYRGLDANGLAFLSAGGCKCVLPGILQWMRPGQGACRKGLMWLKHQSIEHRCGWAPAHDKRALRCCPFMSASLHMHQQGEMSICCTSWSVPHRRNHDGRVLESRSTVAMNLATSTSFRDDSFRDDESRPAGDLDVTRRRGEFKVDLDDAEPHKSPEFPRGGEVEVHMIYTWDGDLMPSGRGFNEDSETDEHSLADGEYAVYNDDGDEANKFIPWELSATTDSWDTYDTNFVDPLSIKFAQRAGFSIPKDYDWNATTSENYRAPAKGGNFFGKYKKVRERMDYAYHVNYAQSRQMLQDEIVTHWREIGVPSDRPWVIFTAGAMGAGKSHTIKMLQAFGCCALTAMVKVDPDMVKYQLPEMQEYIRRNPGPDPDANIILAGHATHNESAFLQVLMATATCPLLSLLLLSHPDVPPLHWIAGVDCAGDVGGKQEHDH